eukprot:8300982-Pyramimonas_sp.AAC.1
MVPILSIVDAFERDACNILVVTSRGGTRRDRRKVNPRLQMIYIMEVEENTMWEGSARACVHPSGSARTMFPQW